MSRWVRLCGPIDPKVVDGRGYDIITTCAWCGKIAATAVTLVSLPGSKKATWLIDLLASDSDDAVASPLSSNPKLCDVERACLKGVLVTQKKHGAYSVFAKHKMTNHDVELDGHEIFHRSLHLLEGMRPASWAG